jgi:hypothetical protein
MNDLRGITNKIYVSWGIIEMDCRNIDMCDCNIGLCYDGQD